MKKNIHDNSYVEKKTRKGCKDTFHAFMVKDAEFDASSLHLLKPLIKKKPVKANVRKTKTPVPTLTFYLSLHDIIAELGAAVYRYRKTARMSREMICKLSGVSITMLCMFENGQLRTFNESVAAVLKALDIECDENMNIPPEIFWRNIRSLRKHKRYLASEFAKRIGCSNSYLSALERGETIPNITDTVFKAAAIFNMTPAEVVRYQP